VTGLLLSFAREGEESTIRQAVERLHEAGATTVIAVGTPVSAPVLSGLGATDIVAYGDGGGRRSVVRDLRAWRPAAAAITYSDADCRGHLKLEALALLSGARQVVRVTPEGGADIGRASLALVVLGKGIGALGRLLLGAAICSTALVCLSAGQRMAGGSRANRD
jgi:hypothetical protein